jgi:hypothetical protein
MAEPDSTDPIFRVHRWTHWLGGLIERTAGLWVALGNLETRQLAERLRDVAIDRPIYVCSLARAGTTLLLEFLARHEGVVSHQGRDYPSLFTPAWWTEHVARQPRRAPEPVERAQGDGIVVTPESPEALEEILWMRFFPSAHDPAVSHLLDRATAQPAFERFYADHLRKLLWARNGRRYVAKNNYHLTRLAYLRRIWPDARFVIPVRHPVSHVASLLRQHRRFCQGVAEEPRAAAHLRRTGHFEFGPDFRPINVGDSPAAAEIARLVASDPVRGFARYWAQLFRFLTASTAADEALGQAALVLRFEDLCSAPRRTLERIEAHVGLAPDVALLREYADRIRLPSYYDRGLDEAEQATIWQECENTAAELGYTDPAP